MSIALPPPQEPGAGLFTRLRHTPLRDLLRGRLSGRLDWQRALAGSGLPPTAQAPITLVVRRSKLWRLEKAQICDELIAHFQDGLDAGVSIEELVRDFGDPGQTAKLIRRAKKKLRPLWWHGLKRMTRSVAALIVAYAGLTVYYMNDKVTIKTDYLAQLNAVALATPESERAWPVYRDTLMKWPGLWEEAKIESVNEENQPVNFSAVVAEIIQPDRPTEPTQIRPGTPAWEMMARELDAHQNELARIREVAANPHLGFVAGFGYAKEDIPFYYYGKYAQYAPQALRREHKMNVSLSPKEAEENSTLGVTMYYLADIKNKVGGVLVADMDLAMAQGDAKRVLVDVQALFGLARQIDHEGSALIEQLIGLSIHHAAVVQLAKAIDRNPPLFDADMLEKLASMTRQCPPIRMHLDGERMWIMDTIQSTYTDDGHGDGHFAAKLDSFSMLMGMSADKTDPWKKSFAVHVVQPARSLLAASRKENTDLVNQYFDQLEAEAQIPMWKMPISIAQEKMVRDFFPHTSWNSIRFPLLGIFMPVLGQARGSFFKISATHSALQLGIALHRHKLAHGAFPAKLADLVPTYLKELPPDPITGGPLHYRLDAKGKPIVWSVGADKVDDGGYAPVNRSGEADNAMAQKWLAPEDLKKAAKGDWILWPMSDLPMMPAK